MISGEQITSIKYIALNPFTDVFHFCHQQGALHVKASDRLWFLSAQYIPFQ